MCLVYEIYGICGPELKGSMSIILLLYKMTGLEIQVFSQILFHCLHKNKNALSYPSSAQLRLRIKMLM